MRFYEHNLGQRFARIVGEHADRCAVLYPDGTTRTYAELDGLVNQTAHFLRDQGLGPGDVVALFSDKSPASLSVMIACLKLGIIYTNLDPESPLRRVQRIVDMCRPKFIVSAIADLEFNDSLNTKACSAIVLDERIQAAIASCPEDLPHVGNVPGSSPAYIMFTSGSTGYPKGAAISHASLLNFVDWAAERFQISVADRFTHVNPPYFDNSVFDFYAALFNGASLVPVAAADTRDPRRLTQIVTDTACTIWFSVPSLLVYLLTARTLTREQFTHIRKIIFGGEGFPKPKLRQLFDLYADRVDLENVYGPTECTCICSANTICEQHFEDQQNLAPLGQLAPNFDYELLPVEGASKNVGELFLTGPQVGLGYYHDPERTALAFVQNPTHSRFRDIGYRTGDLVERDAQGELHFRGRVDFQIKHMGYRIELEEVEAGLNSLTGVDEAAAVYQKLGEGLGQIVGFVAMAGDSNGRDLRSEVAKILPDYMLPRRINRVESLPKNQNGKIDRPALLKSLESRSIS